MNLSHEGVALLMRVLLIVFLGTAAGVFRFLIGRTRRGGQLMLAGTLGGISLGLFLSSLVSRWVHADASVVCACVGLVVGWSISFLVARRLPMKPLAEDRNDLRQDSAAALVNPSGSAAV